jgi:hypothetical protein
MHIKKKQKDKTTKNFFLLFEKLEYFFLSFFRKIFKVFLEKKLFGDVFDILQIIRQISIS